MTEDELIKMAEEFYGGDLLALYEDLDARTGRADLNLQQAAIREDLRTLERMLAERDWETDQEHALEDGAGSASPSTHQPKGTL